MYGGGGYGGYGGGMGGRMGAFVHGAPLACAGAQRPSPAIAAFLKRCALTEKVAS